MNTPVSEKSTLKPHPSVVFTLLSDQEAVLLHMENKFYYSLNSTGSYMWQLIEASDIGPQDLVQELCSNFKLSTEQAKTDVDEFLNDLMTEKLLEKS